MKNTKLFLTIGLLISILLSACQPAVNIPNEEPQVPPKEDGPIDDSKDNPQDVYPADGPKDTYPVEGAEGSTGVAGNLDYVTNPIASSEELNQLSNGANQFAVELYKQLIDKEGNLIYSPFSIYQALVMAYAGAEGETAEQMMKALGIKDGNQIHQVMNALNLALHAEPSSSMRDIQPLIFNIANALWAQKDYHFEQAFLDKLSANYAAGINLVGYNNPEEARQLINTWVAAQTNDKIKELIPQGMLSEMTRMVLTNAVYFKGAWMSRFDAKQTAPGTFTTLDGSSKMVDMMKSSLRTGGLVTDQLSAVTLNYEGGNYAMALIMPEDFAAFQKDLSADMIEKVLNDLKSGGPMVHLTMPKFKAESAIDLGKNLRELGINHAFDAELADFSGMTGKKDLFISDVVHKAFIDVNEDGTEAAAATAIGMNTTSLPLEEYTITLDKPFIYLIYNTETNTIVFMGHVVAP